jgi:hypothetical protein
VTAVVVGSGALFGGAAKWIFNVLRGLIGGDDIRTEPLPRETRGFQQARLGGQRLENAPLIGGSQ